MTTYGSTVPATHLLTKPARFGGSTQGAVDASATALGEPQRGGAGPLDRSSSLLHRS